MSTLDLTHTKAAIVTWDDSQAELDARLEANMTNEEVFAWQADVEALRLQVGQAFYEDTKDRNSPSVVALINPDDPWLRRLLKKYG